MIGNINEKIYHCTKTVMIFKCEIQLKKKQPMLIKTVDTINM